MTADLQVLFCSDPLVPARVDEHFAPQAAVVRDLGGTVAVIDHDTLVAGDADAAVHRVPRESGSWWYRGWMLPARAYEGLDGALRRRGVELRVPARWYQLAHELPGWYPTFRQVTPESDWMEWTPGRVPAERDITMLASGLNSGPAIVKDYVKSRKHERDEACFIPDLADIKHATAVIARMVELQEETLNGGIVLRRFEDYRRFDGRKVEARVWWVDGVPGHDHSPSGHAGLARAAGPDRGRPARCGSRLPIRDHGHRSAHRRRVAGCRGR